MPTLTDCNTGETCPYGGYREQDQISHTDEPWKTLAEKCWNSPSAFRMGGEAEKAGVYGNPYQGDLCRGLFEAGREQIKSIGLSGTAPLLPAPTGGENGS